MVLKEIPSVVSDFFPINHEIIPSFFDLWFFCLIFLLLSAFYLCLI